MSNIKRIFTFVLLIILCSHTFAHSKLIEIKAKIQDEIITNLDIENEKKYLFFLNPKLENLNKAETDNISKNSLITEIIKKKELEKFFDFSKNNNLANLVEKRLLIKKNIKNKDELIKILNQQKIDYDIINKKLQIETLWNQLIYSKYEKNIVINKEELKKNIQNQFNNMKKNFTYNLSEIVFSENVDEELKTKLSIITNSIEKRGFENTANIYSVSSTSKNGGLIGWVNELQISKQINDSIKKLKIDEISKPIKIQSGYIIIKVNNKKEYKQKIDLEEQLKKVINQEKNRQLNNFSMIFYKRLRKNMDVNEL